MKRVRVRRYKEKCRGEKRVMRGDWARLRMWWTGHEEEAEIGECKRSVEGRVVRDGWVKLWKDVLGWS